MAEQNNLNALILAMRFPSHIQTWLLNWLEQALKYHMKVTIAAYEGDSADIPKKVKSLHLLENTYYFPTSTPAGLFRGLKAYLPVGDRKSGYAWKGLYRLIASRQRLSIKDLVKSVVRAPLIGNSHFDLAHSHSLIASYEYLPLFQAADIPLVTSFHGPTPPGVPFLSAEKLGKVFVYGKLFLVNTNFAKKQLESLGCPPDKIKILPQGTQLNDFPYSMRKRVVGRKLIVLTVGRFQRDKGHKYALEAVAQLIRAGVDVEYRIVGTGPERENLIAYSRELGIDECVSVRGPFVDEVLIREYHEADIFLLPSLNNEDGVTVETQGVVLQEAQACGCLVVATRTGGIPEVLDDGKSAWVVNDRDSNAIADKISWLLANQANWDSWRQEARRWVEARFSSDVLGEKLMEYYRELTSC